MYSERKKLIFQAIERILDEEGSESLTYGNISARCYLHTNTITYYFNSKEDMLIQFFEYIVGKDNVSLPDYYTVIPEDVPPVVSFCRLIDHILDGGTVKSKTRRLLNQLLLPQAESSLNVLKFLNRIQAESSEIELAAIQMYRKTGILNIANERKAFADLTLLSSGCSLIHFFHVKCVDFEYAIHKARERIKKEFLLEEFHDQIVPIPPEDREEALNFPLNWT